MDEYAIDQEGTACAGTNFDKGGMLTHVTESIQCPEKIISVFVRAEGSKER